MSALNLNYYQDVEQVKRFDILISDIHAHNDPYKTIESSVGLTLQEVWDWLCDGGEWAFIVTAHNDAAKVFMRGETLASMRAASEGRVLMSLCTATEEEAAELVEKTRLRILEQHINSSCAGKPPGLIRYDSPDQIFD